VSGRKLIPSKAFEKAWARLGIEQRKAAERAMSRFLEDPSHPGLNFERMQGRPGFWSIRTNKGFRIILKETDDPSTFMLADVGKHDIYRRL
jgi:mRNA-degrading endonuclease RelE of RelBE toxin-antitoxin system